MPTEKTNFYQLSGYATQDIYSDSEMAAALDMTAVELAEALDPERYGKYYITPERSIYSYHAHPLATGAGFEFNRSSYQNNLKKRNLVNWMMSNGLWQRNPEAARQFLLGPGNEIGSENEFAEKLREFIAAWESADIRYDQRIKWHYEHLAKVRQIWRVSKYLDDMNYSSDLLGVCFYGPDEPPTGSFIPWQHLRIHPRYGFYDQRNLPNVQANFIPVVEWQPFCTQGLTPGDLIKGETTVTYPGGYDIVEFVGMVITINDDMIEFTENGRYLSTVFWDEIEEWSKR